ncbi:MAG: hypothetical protein ABFD82_12445 [Syntrophaceae bacterium]
MSSNLPKSLQPMVDRFDCILWKSKKNMNSNGVQQYDYVRIMAIYRKFSKADCMPGTRVPEVGDIAAVIEIYDKPELGYELESVNERGETNWLVTVATSDLVFEKIRPPEHSRR